MNKHGLWKTLGVALLVASLCGGCGRRAFDRHDGDVPTVRGCQADSTGAATRCEPLLIGAGLKLSLVGSLACGSAGDWRCSATAMEISASDAASNLTITGDPTAADTLRVQGKQAGRGELIVTGGGATFVFPYEVKAVHHSRIAAFGFVACEVLGPKLAVLAGSRIELEQRHFADASEKQRLSGHATWHTPSCVQASVDSISGTVSFTVELGHSGVVRVGDAAVSFTARPTSAIDSLSLRRLPGNDIIDADLFALVPRDRDGVELWGLGTKPSPRIEPGVAQLLGSPWSTAHWLLLRNSQADDVHVQWHHSQSVTFPQ